MKVTKGVIWALAGVLTLGAVLGGGPVRTAALAHAGEEPPSSAVPAVPGKAVPEQLALARLGGLGLTEDSAEASLTALVNQYHALPADYAPKVVYLTAAYTNQRDRLRPVASRAFMKMADAAAQEGLRIYNASAYRSYTTQKWVYQRYVNQEGTQEADTYSARPGCSEHQTGLALDINTASLSDHFEETEEYAWLVENSWRYGFILRFPEGKEEITGYQFEPWHYRYVGPAAARVCYENGWTLEEYHARQPAPDR